ncbi:MAG: porin [Rickettsiales bacterium]
MKKILLCTTVLAGFASSAFAAEIAPQSEAMQVSIAGNSKFEGGYIKRDRDHKNRFSFSPNQSTSAFLTSNKVAIKAQGTSDDVTYGAVVRLQTVANSSNGMSDTGMDRSHLFVNTDAGSMQAGTNFAASKLLAVDAGSIAAATGGAVDGDAWSFIDISDRTILGSLVTMNADTLSNRLDSLGESSRKLTYLSPVISGVQVGLSYAHDAENNGAQNFTTENSARYLGRPVSVKNLFSAGLKFSHSLENDVKIQLSLTGDMGKTSKRAYDPQGRQATLTDASGVKSNVEIAEYTASFNNSERNDLKSYSVGSVVEYQGFSAALSYSDDGKSLAPKTSNFTSNWWTAGLGYKNGALATSVTYLNGRKGNKSYADNETINTYPTVSTKAVSLGADYAVLPGLTPFAEVTFVQVKPKRVINGETKQKATVFILGTRAKF